MQNSYFITYCYNQKLFVQVLLLHLLERLSLPSFYWSYQLSLFEIKSRYDYLFLSLYLIVCLICWDMFGHELFEPFSYCYYFIESFENILSLFAVQEILGLEAFMMIFSYSFRIYVISGACHHTFGRWIIYQLILHQYLHQSPNLMKTYQDSPMLT